MCLKSCVFLTLRSWVSLFKRMRKSLIFVNNFSDHDCFYYNCLANEVTTLEEYLTGRIYIPWICAILYMYCMFLQLRMEISALFCHYIKIQSLYLCTYVSSIGWTGIISVKLAIRCRHFVEWGLSQMKRVTVQFFQARAKCSCRFLLHCENTIIIPHHLVYHSLAPRLRCYNSFNIHLYMWYVCWKC